MMPTQIRLGIWTACILALLMAVAATAQAAEAAILHVAADGNDAWSGALPEPNADGTAGPRATITGARQCVFDRCEVGPVGTYGVWFRAGCRDNQLTHSEVFDLGAGGIRIGEGAAPSRTTRRCCATRWTTASSTTGAACFAGR